MATLKQSTPLAEVKTKIKEGLNSSSEKIADVMDELGLIYDKNLHEIPIDELKRPVYSSRVLIDNRVKTLRNSLRDYGFLGGIFVNKDSLQIIDGFYRKKLWKELGHPTIPCYLIECDLPQEKELHLRLNTQLAAFNFADFGLNFSGINLIEDFGFSEEDIKPLPVVENKPKEIVKRPAPEGFTKLSTLLRKESYQKLIDYKNIKGFQQLADAIEALIELADEIN